MPLRHLPALFLVALLLLAAACGDPNVLDEGEVDNHAYHPERTTWVPGPCATWSTRTVWRGSGAHRYTTTDRTCTSYTYVPHVDPEHWRIRIVGTHEGEERREWHRVPQACHDRVQRGQWVRLDGCEVVLR